MNEDVPDTTPGTSTTPGATSSSTFTLVCCFSMTRAFGRDEVDIDPELEVAFSEDEAEDEDEEEDDEIGEGIEPTEEALASLQEELHDSLAALSLQNLEVEAEADFLLGRHYDDLQDNSDEYETDDEAQETFDFQVLVTLRFEHAFTPQDMKKHPERSRYKPILKETASEAVKASLQNTRTQRLPMKAALKAVQTRIGELLQENYMCDDISLDVVGPAGNLDDS